jgi:predicted permease
MQPYGKQLRYVLRRLARSPLFTVISVVTLAAGIGANTAIFSVVNGVLLKPLPFEDPETLVGLWHTAPGLGFDLVNQSPALHFTYREEGQAFEDVGMWDNTQVSVTGLEEPEQVDAMRVTDGTFPILGIQPMIGRRFTKEDDSPGAPETAILGYGYWQSRLGGDAGVIGRTLTVNGRTREIIGVMPPDLRFLRYDPAVYLPFQFDRSQVFVGNFSYQALARLKPGMTVEQANADVGRMIPLATEKFPDGITLGMLREARFAPNIHPLKQDVVRDIGTVLWVLLGTVGMVLLIACANVANLFLVRAEGRQQEVAVRTALGADRGRIAREFLLESVALGMLGGVAGLGLAYAGLRVLVSMGPENLPRMNEISLDPVVLLFTLGVSVLAGLLFGLFPVLKYGSPNLVNALKEGGRGGSQGKEHHRARSILVVSQIALALVLLVGSGLMIRSFQALQQVHPGFERPKEVLTLRISIPDAEVEDDEIAALTHERILERIAEIPGVTSAGFSTSVTMDGWDSNDAIYVEDFPVASEDQIPPIRRFKWISANYFETMENPVLAGRAITWADIHNRAPVVVVTENFATEYWESPAAAIGKRIRQGPDEPWREIIGVVGNVHDDGVGEDARTVIYWPQVMTNFWDNEIYTQRSMAYAIRSNRLATGGLLADVRRAVWSVNPNLPLANVRTLEELLERSMARTSFTLVMLGIAAGVALLLGAVGIYGVISYAVAQRTREIGVRIALGARHQGLGASVGLTRLMSALLFGVDPVDPVTYGAVSVGLAGIALLASYLPARRAASVDPIEALRWE